ncbi:MATE family efflux transporter [Candidatus Protochlamydia phocaeensis]|uniref:MATE family efflux transporter n=1 Tax=Candidatus Protochlamydia phocaeensis TaxID=1414722 RepID=UPI000839710D|nr:MATE family efflux transporter [Candidatus Protochlamydia phocaeensis]
MQKEESSIWQLWTLTFPLLLSSLSGMAMLFVDRLILAYYSLDAHNAAVESMNLGWAFLTGWMALASIGQVFVAQNFGAGHYRLLGQPVWQMIWLGIFSCLIFWPAAVWGPGFFFGSEAEREMQRTYLFWMVLFGPAHVIFAGLSSFFIGQKKILITSFVVLMGNLINTSLCCLLVFGWGEWIPSLGIQGSAISTNAAVLGQIIILAVLFFRRSNREQFGTNCWRWNPSLLGKCIKIGLPSAVFGILEVAGWAIFYQMMASMGEKHLTVAGIVQNVLILFNFFGEGLSRAVAILSGNAIGAKQPQAVYKFVHAGFVLMTLFAIVLALVLWLTNQTLINWFLSTASEEQRTLFYSSLIFGLANVVIYKYLEGIRLIISGALTAAADTVFLLVGGTCSIWLFMVIPIYHFVVKQSGSIELALALCSVYTLLAACLYAWRFYWRGWQKNTSLVLSPA